MHDVLMPIHKNWEDKNIVTFDNRSDSFPASAQSLQSAQARARHYVSLVRDKSKRDIR
jgi:hypothetical protein